MVVIDWIFPAEGKSVSNSSVVKSRRGLYIEQLRSRRTLSSEFVQLKISPDSSQSESLTRSLYKKVHGNFKVGFASYKCAILIACILAQVYLSGEDNVVQDQFINSSAQAAFANIHGRDYGTATAHTKVLQLLVQGFEKSVSRNYLDLANSVDKLVHYHNTRKKFSHEEKVEILNPLAKANTKLNSRLRTTIKSLMIASDCYANHDGSAVVYNCQDIVRRYFSNETLNDAVNLSDTSTNVGLSEGVSREEKYSIDEAILAKFPDWVREVLSTQENVDTHNLENVDTHTKSYHNIHHIVHSNQKRLMSQILQSNFATELETNIDSFVEDKLRAMQEEGKFSQQQLLLPNVKDLDRLKHLAVGNLILNRALLWFRTLLLYEPELKTSINDNFSYILEYFGGAHFIAEDAGKLYYHLRNISSDIVKFEEIENSLETNKIFNPRVSSHYRAQDRRILGSDVSVQFAPFVNEQLVGVAQMGAEDIDSNSLSQQCGALSASIIEELLERGETAAANNSAAVLPNNTTRVHASSGLDMVPNVNINNLTSSRLIKQPCIFTWLQSEAHPFTSFNSLKSATNNSTWMHLFNNNVLHILDAVYSVGCNCGRKNLGTFGESRFTENFNPVRLKEISIDAIDLEFLNSLIAWNST